MRVRIDFETEHYNDKVLDAKVAAAKSYAEIERLLAEDEYSLGEILGSLSKVKNLSEWSNWLEVEFLEERVYEYLEDEYREENEK